MARVLRGGATRPPPNRFADDDHAGFNVYSKTMTAGLLSSPRPGSAWTNGSDTTSRHRSPLASPPTTPRRPADRKGVNLWAVRKPNRGAANKGGDDEGAIPVAASSKLSERPLRISDLDWSEPVESWIKRPLYSTHHRRPNCEQLAQAIHLPPMHRCHRYRADEGASWDPIAENAFQAMHRFHGADYLDHARTHGGKHKTSTVVGLLYCARGNPFHKDHIDVLKRARKALAEFPHVAVAGALVVPASDVALMDLGISKDRRLTFATRVELARRVAEDAGQADWIIVDSCM